MHIAQNWRMRGTRLRFEGTIVQNGAGPRGVERFSGGVVEHPDEKRHIGAMLIFHDEANNIWITPDDVKNEQVGQFYTGAYEFRDFRWGTVGGAQQGKELINGTIIAEFLEEVIPNKDALKQHYTRQFLSNLDYQRISPHFLVVNQENAACDRLARIGVSVWSVSMPSKSQFHQELKQYGLWVRANTLAEVMSDNYQLFRPQLIYAVKMYCGKLGVADIKKLNLETIAVGDDLIAEKSLPNRPITIQKGVIGDTGELLEANWDTRHYLGLV